MIKQQFLAGFIFEGRRIFSTIFPNFIARWKYFQESGRINNEKRKNLLTFLRGGIFESKYLLDKGIVKE
jgi:hypothetical protein